MVSTAATVLVANKEFTMSRLQMSSVITLHPTTPCYLSQRPDISRNTMDSGKRKSVFGTIKRALGKTSNTPNSVSRKSTLESRSSSAYPNAPQTNNSVSSGFSQQLVGTSNDPPPAYSSIGNTIPVLANPAGVNAQISNHQLLEDDPYAFLSSFDTVFVIDDSGSMAGASWRETGKALEAITPICTAHDADGIDIYFLNHRDNPYYRNVKQASTVKEIFQTVRPMGGTPTGQKLNNILKPYIHSFEKNQNIKPMNIIVITDGEPSDCVESTLISAAKKLDKLDAPAWQVGVQFFQVGREPAAREHLKQLDDELADIAGMPLRDMVDTVPWTGAEGQQLTADGILKVVLGSVVRKLDRKKSTELYSRRRS